MIQPTRIGVFATALWLVAFCAGPRRAQAQYLTRPALAWETITTQHFAIHFPRRMQAWAMPVASRMESVAAAVDALAGNAPTARVTIVIEDPSNVSNGFALPFLRGPVIFFWPTPPVPAPNIGSFGDWGEMLSVHEYGHIAHLTYPSRNPRDRFFWSLFPAEVGPVVRKAPAWVVEGYATLIEGRLTANGRPSSVGRAAVLREWALEGKLPIYGQLDQTGSFFGGSMRYLVGSAYLQWLQGLKGDSSLVHLWRRMSARVDRSFGSAFAGVFGASPADMYGRFFVDLTADALDVRRRLTAAGLVDGELVQRLNGATGEPAVSPDGKLVAVALHPRMGRPRLVVWPTAADTSDSAEVRARRRLLERDSLDVPAIDSFPRPKRAVATLWPSLGRSHEYPRWFADNERVLVSRDEPLGDGTTRPDLFVWNYRTGALRRVTRGLGIRYADPSPDGRTAVGARCADGVCSLVLVDLATGGVRVLAPGRPDVVWSRPRWSPNGRTIAASVHRNGRWQVALVDAATGAVEARSPEDGVARYAAAFQPTDDRLLVVSERGGIANLALLDMRDGTEQALTRVEGAVLAPAVDRADHSAWFLSMHAAGYDLRRLPLDSTTNAGRVVVLGDSLAPAAPEAPQRPAARFDSQAVAPRPYGLGPRGWRWLPGGAYGVEGALGTLLIANMDPVDRLSVLAQGGGGSRGTWRGGSIVATYRRLPFDVTVGGWRMRQRPSEQREPGYAPRSLDATYTGGSLLLERERAWSRFGYLLGGGGALGTLDGPVLSNVGRQLAIGEASGRLTFGLGHANYLVAAAGGSWAIGKTAGEAWTRGVARASLTGGKSGQYLRAEAVRGATLAAAPDEFGRRYEAFLVGGHQVPWLDPLLLSQRIALPAVPVGYAAGRQIAVLKATVVGLVPGALSMTWVAAGDSLVRWQRVATLETGLTTPSLGFVRVPAVGVRAGIGYSFSAPFRYRLRAYAAIRYRP